MNNKRFSQILVGVLILLGVVLLASVYGANQLLGSKSDELVGVRAEAMAAEQQKAALEKAQEDLETYGELNEIAQSVVPKDKDQAKAVNEIVKLAGQSGIPRLSSIAFPPSTLGGAKPGLVTQATKVKGMDGVYTLPITITQAPSDPVSYNSFINFLSKLENNRRTALVSSINVQPNAERPDQVSFTLVIDEYIKP